MVPRRLPLSRNFDLYHIGNQDQLQLTTSDNLPLSFAALFLAMDGLVCHRLHCDIGVRQEEARITLTAPHSLRRRALTKNLRTL